MIVAFVTMLLGLTAGVRTVEVAVAEPVARVEILFDGAAVGVITGEPWRLEVDLGDELAPHRLVAVARDAAGVELGRAEQWINLLHVPVEAQLLLKREGGRHPHAARLIWSAIDQGTPREVSVSFDGEPLEIEDPGHIPLPEFDPEGFHFLRAELRFSGTTLAVAEAAFGGVFGEKVATEIQALALALEKGAELPAPAALGGWMTKDGAPLPVRAVDAGPADVMLVLDLAAKEAIAALQRANVVRQPVRPPRRPRADPNVPGYTPAPAPPRRTRSRAVQRVPMPAVLHGRDRVRFVYPIANPGSEEEPGSESRSTSIFPISEPFTLEQGGLFDLLARVNLPAGEAPQRLADAVAVAGRQTYAGHRRRVVVLVVGERPVDGGRFRLPAARRYLSRLKVPLVVWRIGEPESDVGGPRSAAAAAAPLLDGAELGPAVAVSGLQQLKAALAGLRRELDAQRIVWVEGHHLPQEVDLGAAAKGVGWAGSANGLN